MTYRIKNWSDCFETHETRKLRHLAWVPVPNKHDGEGFRYIMAHKRGIIIYGCWHLILQVASKCDPRGTLVRADGTPHTAESIAMKTGWTAQKDIQEALDFCASPQVAWIETLNSESPGVSRNLPEQRVSLPDEGKGREGKGTEGNTLSGKQEDRASILSRWNDLAKLSGLAEIAAMSDTRWKKYQSRLETFPDFWQVVSTEIQSLSDFARGIEPGKNWRLDFDFCVASDGNFLKLKEGKYRKAISVSKNNPDSWVKGVDYQ